MRFRSPATARILGLGVGYAADRLVGDPQRHHPVAWFGTAAGAVEPRIRASSRRRGTIFTVLALTPPVIGTISLARGSWLRRAAVIGLTTWAALGGRSLEREAMAVHHHLVTDDLPAARARIRSLVGRDVSESDAGELARAVIESLAENQSDAVAATLVWGALAGAPGVVLHRCANTLDAMVGHHNERFEQFGWASARFDDLLNWLPSRVSTVLTILCAGSLPGASGALRAVRRDASKHPSPNAGPVEAAAAGALGVRLGGQNIYGTTVEDRGQLGDGRAVCVDDIPRAVALERQVGRCVIALACGALGGIEIMKCSKRRVR